MKPSKTAIEAATRAYDAGVRPIRAIVEIAYDAQFENKPLYRIEYGNDWEAENTYVAVLMDGGLLIPVEPEIGRE